MHSLPYRSNIPLPSTPITLYTLYLLRQLHFVLFQLPIEFGRSGLSAFSLQITETFSIKICSGAICKGSAKLIEIRRLVCDACGCRHELALHSAIALIKHSKTSCVNHYCLDVLVISAPIFVPCVVTAEY